MAQQPRPGDRVRYWHHPLGYQTGIVWSNGPRHDTWWVIPDRPELSGLVQGCYEARRLRIGLLARYGADAREVVS